MRRLVLVPLLVVETIMAVAVITVLEVWQAIQEWDE